MKKKLLFGLLVGCTATFCLAMSACELGETPLSTPKEYAKTATVDGVALQLKQADEQYYEITGYEGTSTTLTLPSEYDGLAVKSIVASAFANSSLSSVVIADSITSVGEEAFSKSQLTSVTVGAGVAEIGAKAFYSCKLITSVVWNAVSCQEYGLSVFTSSGAESGFTLTVGAAVSVLPSGAFSGCSKLREVTFAENSVCTKISDNTFYGCSGLQTIEFPESLQEIGKSGFYGCSSLTSIRIPENVTSIGTLAFQNCYKLVEVCNDSTLSIKVGSHMPDSCYVSFRAKYVYTSKTGTSKLFYDGDFLFFAYNATTYYLMGVKDNNLTSLDLPLSVKKDGVKVADSYSLWVDTYLSDTNCSFVFARCRAEWATVPTFITQLGQSVFSETVKTIYYRGTEEAWNAVERDASYAQGNASVYFYSEEAPSSEGKYWHNVDGTPTKW